MNGRFTIFAFGVSACFAFIGYANMYNDWAQENAVNLMCGVDPICRMSKALIPSKERIRKMATAIKRDSNALSRPNVGLISSNEILIYPYVNRYFTELDNKDISHYYILREDYTFQDLSGGSITIPAGFIWDGASIPKVLGALPVVGLEVGNTRYNSALSEGLIHDYMYRDPRRFSKEEADDLLYVNLVRCRNANPVKIYEGVQVGGRGSYQGHKKRQDQGHYDVFTPEFYAGNLKTFQRGNDSTLEKKAEATQQPVDLHSLNLDDPNGDWCKCESPGCRANMDAKKGYVMFGCTKCKKVNVKYAKMALELEQKMKAAGNTPTWFGPNAEASAHKAAAGK